MKDLSLIFIITLSLFASVLLLCEQVVAQGILAISPDTLLYDGKPDRYQPDNPEVDVISLVNLGNDELIVDSISHTRYQATAWGIEVLRGDSTMGDIIHLGSFDEATRPTNIIISPADTVLLWVRGYDRCTICGGLVARNAASTQIVDTFFVYTNATLSDSNLIYVDTSELPNAIENPIRFPEAIKLEVRPNPIHRDAELIIKAQRVGEHNIALFDLLGRRLVSKTVLLKSGDPKKIRWQSFSRSLPAGIYFLRIVGPEKRTAIQAVTIL